MNWYWYNSGDRDPFAGVARTMSADLLIERLLRRESSRGAAPNVMPDVLAQEIKQSLVEHAKSTEASVVSKMGIGFEAGDQAEITIDLGGLSFRVQISASAQNPSGPSIGEDDDFDFDDDELDADEPEEVSR